MRSKGIVDGWGKHGCGMNVSNLLGGISDEGGWMRQGGKGKKKKLMQRVRQITICMQ